jgi:CSLREA domain-containing protein
MTKTIGGLLGLCLLAAPLSAATVTVNDAGDASGACATTGTGTCTLRDALTYANAHGGSTIAFAIAGAGVHTIAPAAVYPDITAAVTIDGFTQPGSSPNSNGPGLADNSVHLIEINGAATGPGSFPGVLRLKAGSGGSVVRGLVVNRSPGAGIGILAIANAHVEGCFLGTDASGAAAPGSQFDGVLVDQSATNATIGGITPAARNVISGNLSAGVDLGGGSDHGGSGHLIQGNFIGTNAAGTAAVATAQTGVAVTRDCQNVTIGGTTPSARNVIAGNGGRGISISSSIGNPGVTGIVVEGNYIGTDVTGAAAIGNGFHDISVASPNNTIGGSAAGAGNVISASAFSGIQADQASGLLIQGNLIGTDATGTLPLPNHERAISLTSDQVTIGGTGAGEGNVIAFNGTGAFSGGVRVESGTGDTIRGNSMFGNAIAGIDLGTDGVTPNDAGDADTGPNNRQNFPLIKTVTYGAQTQVAGLLHSVAATTFDVDVYWSPACSDFPREFDQGENYLGSGQVTTDGSGNGAFNLNLPAVPNGSRISATVTDPGGSTSEFSERLPFSINIRSGPPAGGTAINIAGTDFAAGATVTVGGQPATGVAVNSSLSIDATMPALAAGTANDLVVQNVDGSNGTLRKAFVADFLDVPGGNGFSYYVTTLVSNGITAGIGGGLYGINDSTLRQQMAVFILKAEHGLCYAPPPCAGTFSDVPCPSTFAPWIEAMALEGITGGCGGGKFCPQNPVRRDQMAVFLLKGEHGSTYVPPNCSGVFLDVPCPSQFANWIERLNAENITGGCGNNNYCPTNDNTRGQMAVFIVKTFSLQ